MSSTLMHEPAAWRVAKDATPAAAPKAPVGNVVIATLNRLHGNTGVHTHTLALRDGLRAAGTACDVVTAFDNPPHWLALFAVRPVLLDRIWRNQSIHWYRHWHAAALRQSLRRYLSRHDVQHIIAQCPVSARAALDVRHQLESDAKYAHKLLPGLPLQRQVPAAEAASPAGFVASSNGSVIPRRMSVTLVCHFNRSEPDEYRSQGELRDEAAYLRMMKFEEAVLAEVDQVVYVSQWAREMVENDRRVTPRRSVVIHNGIPASPGTNRPMSSAAVYEEQKAPSQPLQAEALDRDRGLRPMLTPENQRIAKHDATRTDRRPVSRRGDETELPIDDLSLAHDDLMLINIGTLEPRKNQLGLIDLFDAVQSRIPRAKLFLVGDGPDAGAIRLKVTALGLTHRVVLLGRRNDVAWLLERADLYVHYSELENCPMVILEAARAGLPWAAISAAGIVELQESLGGSVAIDPLDLAGSADAIASLLQDDRRRRNFGMTAREGFLKAFTQQKMVDAYLDALRSCDACVAPDPTSITPKAEATQAWQLQEPRADWAHAPVTHSTTEATR